MGNTAETTAAVTNVVIRFSIFSASLLAATGSDRGNGGFETSEDLRYFRIAHAAQLYYVPYGHALE
jgi:hypothetical protein